MQSSKLDMSKGYLFFQMVYIRVTKRLGLGAEPPRVYKTFLNTSLAGRIGGCQSLITWVISSRALFRFHGATEPGSEKQICSRSTRSSAT